MIVCVFKHTPGVFSDSVNQSETAYSGLEVEVFSIESNLRPKIPFF